MLKRNPSKFNKSFCAAPWIHTYVSPQSERRLCCTSREKHSYIHQYRDQPGKSGETYNPKTLEEHWNGEFIREVRQKMMTGEVVPECEVCTEHMATGHSYKNYFNNTLTPKLLKSIFDNTDDDGKTSLKPVSFDYRFSNLCNFKCRMCGEQLSSAWESEKRRYDRWSPEKEPWMLPNQKNEINKFQKDVVEKEFSDAIENGQIQEIYWVGGEPLIWPAHWKYMKRIVEKGDADKVFCRYNTNLSLINYRGTNFFDDLLPHFKGYTVAASIDAPGSIGEYLRTGLKWERWLENFKHGCRYKEQRGEDSITMDITLTLPGLFAIEELMDYANEFDVKLFVKSIFAFDSTILLSPLALPQDILHPFLDKIIARCQPKANAKTQILIDKLIQLKDKKTFMQAYPADWKEGFKRGKENILYLESIRRSTEITMEDILKPEQDILKWWREEYE